MDNRKFSRILFSSKARIIEGGQSYETELLDLSLKGALVRRPPTWQKDTGTEAILQVVLNDSELQLDMEVSVAHLHEDTLGLRCDRIDIESASHLRRLLELNLGDADLLSRELNELSN